MLSDCWWRKSKAKSLPWSAPWKALELWLGDGKLPAASGAGWLTPVRDWLSPVPDWFKLGRTCVLSGLGLRFRPRSGPVVWPFSVWPMGLMCTAGVNWLEGAPALWGNCGLPTACCRAWFGAKAAGAPVGRRVPAGFGASCCLAVASWEPQSAADALGVIITFAALWAGTLAILAVKFGLSCELPTGPAPKAAALLLLLLDPKVGGGRGIIGLF